MSTLNLDSTDLIQEIRLRKWAREHFVSEQYRDDTDWHPIVLDEMRRKDRELREFESSQTIVTSYVPLAPGASHIIHTGHTEHVRPSIHSDQEADAFLRR